MLFETSCSQSQNGQAGPEGDQNQSRWTAHWVELWACGKLGGLRFLRIPEVLPDPVAFCYIYNINCYIYNINIFGYREKYTSIDRCKDKNRQENGHLTKGSQADVKLHACTKYHMRWFTFYSSFAAASLYLSVVVELQHSPAYFFGKHFQHFNRILLDSQKLRSLWVAVA